MQGRKGKANRDSRKKAQKAQKTGKDLTADGRRFDSAPITVIPHETQFAAKYLGSSVVVTFFVPLAPFRGYSQSVFPLRLWVRFSATSWARVLVPVGGRRFRVRFFPPTGAVLLPWLRR
jgi:hypothetical protein